MDISSIEICMQLCMLHYPNRSYNKYQTYIAWQWHGMAWQLVPLDKYHLLKVHG